MDQHKRQTIKGWIDKASNHLDTAKEHLKWSSQVSDSVQASQVCVEPSVKAILTLLDIDYPPSHGWNSKQLADIVKQIKDRDLLTKLAAHTLDHIVRLARILFRFNFWSHFYLEAKYGLETEHLAPAQELFETEDAELATKHADACLWGARTLAHLPDEKQAEIRA